MYSTSIMKPYIMLSPASLHNTLNATLLNVQNNCRKRGMSPSCWQLKPDHVTRRRAGLTHSLASQILWDVRAHAAFPTVQEKTRITEKWDQMNGLRLMISFFHDPYCLNFTKQFYQILCNIYLLKSKTLFCKTQSRKGHTCENHTFTSLR